MRQRSSVVIAAPRDKILPLVSDLARYPEWMPMVHGVEVLGPGTWSVELRAKVGVFARSKRLTMVRTTEDVELLRFERREGDGREHARWEMTVAVTESNGCSTVTIELFYGGNLWTAGVLDKVLAGQIEAGKEALAARVAHS